MTNNTRLVEEFQSAVSEFERNVDYADSHEYQCFENMKKLFQSTLYNNSRNVMACGSDLTALQKAVDNAIDSMSEIVKDLEDLNDIIVWSIENKEAFELDLPYASYFDNSF